VVRPLIRAEPGHHSVLGHSLGWAMP
jgi:hypothetical protein